MIDFAKAGAVVRKLIDSARKGELAYEERPPVKVDWSAYDMAQVREVVDMLEMIRKLVNHAVWRIQSRGGPQTRDRGRPPTDPGDIAKVLLLQSYMDVPNRVAEGLVLLFGEKLGIDKHFSYKTIERGYDRKGVTEVLDEVFSLTNVPVQGLEKVFSVDGSGSTTSAKQNYAQDRQQQNSTGPKAAWPDGRHDYVHNVAVIGTKYKLFAAWKSTCDRHVGELTLFPEVLRQTKCNHPDMEMMLGDGLYAGRPQCKLVGEVGAVPRFLPRRNATMKRLGVSEWTDMLLSMAENPQAWFSDYHMRSISETGFSVANNRKGPIRKRLDPRKNTESYLRGIGSNIHRLAQLRYLATLMPLLGPTAS